jgi:hypothetical protein
VDQAAGLAVVFAAGEEGKRWAGERGQGRERAQAEGRGVFSLKPFSLFFQNCFAIEFEFNSHKV